jgi:hypothetical protein
MSLIFFYFLYYLFNSNDWFHLMFLCNLLFYQISFSYLLSGCLMGSSYTRIQICIVVYIFSEWFGRTIKFSLLLLFVVDFVWNYNLVTINLEFRWSIGWLRLLLSWHWNRTFYRSISLDAIIFGLRSHFVATDGCTLFLSFLRCIKWRSHVHWKSTFYLWDMFFSRFLPNVFVIVFD